MNSTRRKKESSNEAIMTNHTMNSLLFNIFENNITNSISCLVSAGSY